MKKIVLAFMLVAVFVNPTFAAKFSEGKEYQKVPTQDTDSGEQIEVLEFFWYGCPHCYAFEPFIEGWKKARPANVKFSRVPAVFRPSWKVQARTYYALEAMGKLEDMHGKIFDEIHKKKNRLDSLEKISTFLASQGIDKDEFTKNYRSFSIDAKVRKANKLVKNYNVSGVPTIAVNGKYVTTGSMTGTYEKLIDVVNFLVTEESK